MPSLIRGLGNLLGKLRGRPKPPKPKVVTPTRSTEHIPAGHRGTAIGSLRKPNLSAENVAKWRLLEHGGEDFIFNQALFPVHSSNVAAAQYFADDQKMMVEFLDGSAYLYSNVPIDTAIEFWKSPSKGSFLWDYFRVRGSRTAHKKPYVKLR